MSSVYLRVLAIILGTCVFNCYGKEFEPAERVKGGVYASRELNDIPRVGFGTAGMGQWTTESVCLALRSGFRLIDTAQAPEWYSEELLGEALARCWGHKSIDELLVVTKVHPRSYGSLVFRASLETSRRNIYGKISGVDAGRPLDAVLLHAPFCWEGHCNDDEVVPWQDAWRELEKAQSEGLVTAIGVSNMDVEKLEELLSFADIKPAIVQNWMDPFHQDKHVRSLCRLHNIAYMAYSTFGTQWGHKHKSNPVMTSTVLNEIAVKYDRRVTDVVLSWAVQSPNVVVLPRSTQAPHIASNAALLPEPGTDTYRAFLSKDDWMRIDELDGSIGSLW